MFQALLGKGFFVCELRFQKRSTGFFVWRCDGTCLDACHWTAYIACVRNVSPDHVVATLSFGPVAHHMGRRTCLNSPLSLSFLDLEAPSGCPSRGQDALNAFVILAIASFAAMLACSFVICAMRRYYPSDWYHFFVCHHKRGAAAQSRLLKMMLVDSVGAIYLCPVKLVCLSLSLFFISLYIYGNVYVYIGIYIYISLSLSRSRSRSRSCSLSLSISFVDWLMLYLNCILSLSLSVLGAILKNIYIYMMWSS